MQIKSFLFKNIGIKQTILKNTFWLALSEIILRFSQFLLLIYTIKILGVTDFGKFTFALSFVTIISVFSEFGLSSIVTREFSRDKKIEKQYPDILSLKIILTVGALILMLIGSFFVTSDIAIKKVIWILSFSVLAGNFPYIIYAFFRARQWMEYEAIAKIMQALITAGMVFFVLFNLPSVQNISWGYLIGNLITMAVLLLVFYFFIQPIRLGFNKNIFRKFFLFSQPLGLATIFVVVILNIDSVIMGRLGQVTENGQYGAARMIVNLTIVLATLIWMSFYPVLSNLFKESKERFQRAWDYYTESMIILAPPLAAGGFILAPKIIDFIYGQKFVPSVLAFQILIFSAGINFIYNSYIMVLIVSNQQKKYLWTILVAAVINIIANIILIPLYSFYGASIAMVITSVSILLLSIGFSRTIEQVYLFDRKLVKTTIATFVSCLAMIIVISQPAIYNLNIVLSILIGAVLYSAAIYILYNFFHKLNWLSNKTV